MSLGLLGSFCIAVIFQDLYISELRDMVSVGMPDFGISRVNMAIAYGSDGVVA